MQNSIMKATKREKALKQISQDAKLADIYRLEEEPMEDLISKALNYISLDDHWHNYERLKEMMSQFVGFEASHSELRTNRHYEAMIDFVDWLLVLSRKAMLVKRNEEYSESEELA